MCYNCGCGMPDDDIGKGRVSKGGGSLTNEDLKVIADKWNMDIKEVKKNILETLKSQVKD